MLNRDKEIIIVDDGSVDGTVEKLASIQDDIVKVLYHTKNLGKGAALRTAFEHVSGDIVAIQDADLEYDPRELNELIEPIVRGDADVVYGSRLSGGKLQRVYLFWHKVGNIFLTLITNILFNTTLTDIETCYKVFRSNLLKELNLKSNDFTIEAEITAKLLKKKLRIFEMPISYYGRTYAEGKKIAGVMVLAHCLRFSSID